MTIVDAKFWIEEDVLSWDNNSKFAILGFDAKVRNVEQESRE